MRNARIAMASLLVCALVAGCHDSTAKVRVQNERSTKANVQLKDAASNTTNINDVTGGTVSGDETVAPGPYTVTAVIQNESVSPTTAFTVEAGQNYTVVVVAGDPPTLRVDQR